MRLSAFVEGIGVLGPGLADWPTAVQVLSGAAPWVHQPCVLPAPAMLPAAERRRTGSIVRLALAVGLEAVAASGRDAAQLATVFSSSNADGDNCHAICEALAGDDRHISPTRFHNSVHNAPAGYWGIATRSMAPSTSLCAGDASFGAGLLEAMTQVVMDGRGVVLIAGETPYPEPLRAARPIADSFGVALVLSAAASPHSLARIHVALAEPPGGSEAWGLTPPEGSVGAGLPANGASEVAGKPAPTAGLEHLRRTVPAARSLPLLQALARGAAARVTLDYLDGLALAVEVAPCG